jgi:hypothetical protein
MHHTLGALLVTLVLGLLVAQLATAASPRATPARIAFLGLPPAPLAR